MEFALGLDWIYHAFDDEPEKRDEMAEILYEMGLMKGYYSIKNDTTYLHQSSLMKDGWETINRTNNWQTVGIDAHEAIDGDIATAWHSEGLTPITIDLGEVIDIAGFCYAPMADGGKGTIYRYNAYVSEDGETWTECICDGEFSNIKNNPVPYFVNLGCRLSTRYLRIEPLSEVNDMNATSVAEIGVLLAR